MRVGDAVRVGLSGVEVEVRVAAIEASILRLSPPLVRVNVPATVPGERRGKKKMAKATARLTRRQKSRMKQRRSTPCASSPGECFLESLPTDPLRETAIWRGVQPLFASTVPVGFSDVEWAWAGATNSNG